MMASDSLLAPALYRCYYCQFESTENSFKYFDNKKVDQPRHQCLYCHKLFTLGSHGRPQGKTYAKKRNEDPAELKSLSRQCRHCGVADIALFKYYNNNNRLQPRFKCLSCGQQFQMRLMGSSNEMRLVHTSCKQRHATSRSKKPREPEAFTNASNFGEKIYQPSAAFMPMPFDPLMALEPSARLLPESCAQEDVQYASFLETELTHKNESPNVDPISPCNANVDNGLLPELSTEEAELVTPFEFESFTDENERAPNADPIICTFNGDDGLPLGLSGAENAEFLTFLEAGFLTDGNEAPWNVDTFSSTANVDDGLLPWSDNDAGLIEYELTETSVRANKSDDTEMVSKNMTNMDSDCASNPEVVSGTLSVETLAPVESNSWSNDTVEDSSSVDYLEAAVACCNLMDMPAHSMPVAPVQLDESSSSNAGFESDSWSNDTIEDPSSLNYLEAAVACCNFMDMAHSMPVAPVQFGESSSSNAGLTISFDDSSCATSEPVSFQQDLMEEDQRSVSDWNEWQEEEDDM